MAPFDASDDDLRQRMRTMFSQSGGGDDAIRSSVRNALGIAEQDLAAPSKPSGGGGGIFNAGPLGWARDRLGDAGNVALSALEGLDYGRAFTVAAVSELGDAVNVALGGEVKKTDPDGDGRFTNTGVSFGDILANTRDRAGVGDIIEHADPDANIWLKRAGGFVGDVVLDPLTYVGVGAVAKASGASTRAAGRAGARGLARGGGKRLLARDEAARRILGASDEVLAKAGTTRAEARELANQVRRSNTGAFANNTRLADELGIDTGIRFMKYTIPGTQSLARGSAKLSGAVKTRVFRKLSDRISPDTWAKWENVPGFREVRNRYDDATALQFADVVGGSRHNKMRFMGKHGETLSDIVKPLRGKPSKVKERIWRAADEGTIDQLPQAEREIAKKLDDWYKAVADDYEKLTGVQLDRIENYVHRELTEEFKEMFTTVQRRGRGAESSPLKGRKIKPGAKFFGETLEEGTYQEAKEILERALPEGTTVEMFVTDPIVSAHAYLSKLSRTIQLDNIRHGLVDIGLAEVIDTIGLNRIHQAARKNEQTIAKAVKGLDNVRAKAKEARAQADETAAEASRVGDELADIQEQAETVEAAVAEIDRADALVDAAVDSTQVDLDAAEAGERMVRTLIENEGLVETYGSSVEKLRVQHEKANVALREARDAGDVETLRGAVEEAKAGLKQAKAEVKRQELIVKNAKTADAKRVAAEKRQAWENQVDAMFEHEAMVRQLYVEARQTADKMAQAAKDLNKAKGGSRRLSDDLMETFPTGVDDPVAGQIDQIMSRSRIEARAREIQDELGVVSHGGHVPAEARAAAWMDRTTQAVEALPENALPGARKALFAAQEDARKFAQATADQKRLQEAMAQLSPPGRHQVGGEDFVVTQEAYDRAFSQLRRNLDVVDRQVEATEAALDKHAKNLAFVEERTGMSNPVDELVRSTQETGGVVSREALEMAEREAHRDAARAYTPVLRENRDALKREVKNTETALKKLGGDIPEQEAIVAKSAETAKQVDDTALRQAQVELTKAEKRLEAATGALETRMAEGAVRQARRERDRLSQKLRREAKRLEGAKRTVADNWATLNSMETVDNATVQELQAMFGARRADAERQLERLSGRKRELAQERARLLKDGEAKLARAAELEAEGQELLALQLKYEATAEAAEALVGVTEGVVAGMFRQAGLSDEQMMALARTGDKNFAEYAKQVPHGLQADSGWGDLVRDYMSQKLVQYGTDHPDVWMDPEMLTAINRIADLDHQKITGFMRVHDKVLSRWKAWALVSPGYHSRNFQTAIMMNGLAGMDSTLYLKFGRAWRKLNKAKTPEQLQAAFNQIKDPQLRDAMSQLWDNRHVLFGGRGVSQQIQEEVMRQTGRVNRGGLLPESMRRIDPTNLDNALIDINFRAASATERLARGPLFLDSILRGETVEEAIQRVAIHHFDYSDLSYVEQRYFKRIIPFYTWTRKNFPIMLNYMARKPGGFMWYLHAKRNLEAGTYADEVVPSYFGDDGAIRLPSDMPFLGGLSTELGGQGTRYLAPDLPFLRLHEQFDTGTIMGQVTPFIKLPYEINAGKKVFQDIPFQGNMQEAPDSWGWFMPLLNVAGGEFGLPRVERVNGKYYLTDKDAYKIEQAWPILGRTRRIFPGDETFYADRRFTSVMSTIFGVGALTNTEGAQAGELRRREHALRDAAKVYEQIQKLEQEG